MEKSQNKQYLEASGFSMWPFLRQGARIIVEDVPVAELTSGNIILYKVDAQQVCHRLVAKRKSSGKYLLFTRGDYVNSWKTETISQEQFCGRVCGIVRSSKNGGKERIVSLKGIRQAILGMIIITVFPLIVIIFTKIRKMLGK